MGKQKPHKARAEEVNGAVVSCQEAVDMRHGEYEMMTILMNHGLEITRLTNMGLRVPCRLRIFESSSRILLLTWQLQLVRCRSNSGNGESICDMGDALPLHMLLEVECKTNSQLDDKVGSNGGLDVEDIEISTDNSPRQSNGCIITLKWPEMTLSLEANTTEERDTLTTCFLQLKEGLQATIALQNHDMEIATEEKLKRRLFARHEKASDDSRFHRFAEGFVCLNRRTTAWRVNSLGEAISRWCAVVRKSNAVKMEADRAQWTLHAEVRQDEDLQAWYHSVFRTELYRTKGPFWHKEALLQDYRRHPMKTVNRNDTPESVLCTPDMTYATMAATMYTIREKLSEEEYRLFEKLTSDGSIILKHGRKGSPQKKLFQLSLVQGEMYLFMYLTWKGKHGTQGVELASVKNVSGELATDTSHKSGKMGQKEHYISFIMPDRSLNLYFEDSDQQAVFLSCMDKLITMEKHTKNSQEQ